MLYIEQVYHTDYYLLYLPCRPARWLRSGIFNAHPLGPRARLLILPLDVFIDQDLKICVKPALARLACRCHGPCKLSEL
jgi:hypothetical protein